MATICTKFATFFNFSPKESQLLNIFLKPI